MRIRGVEEREDKRGTKSLNSEIEPKTSEL